MKPLLAPARCPHSEVLQHALGMSGIFFSDTFERMEQLRESLVRHLVRSTSANDSDLQECLEVHGRNSLRTYVLGSHEENTGNVSFACNLRNGRFWTSMSAMLLWRCLPPSTEQLVPTVDRIWQRADWSVLYAYDEDDFGIQNDTMLLAIDYYGVDRNQVTVVPAPGGLTEEIDTRANPGYFLNHDGLFWSVQWLNYWSAEAQDRMFGKLPPALPEGITVKDMGDGAVRVRLGERPGKYDDVEFHKLQLEFRRSVPFRLSGLGVTGESPQ